MLLWLEEVSDFVARQLILSVLNSHGKLNLQEIAYCSNVPERTIRYNLKKLKQQNLVREKIVFDDLRQKIFELWGDVNAERS